MTTIPAKENIVRSSEIAKQIDEARDAMRRAFHQAVTASDPSEAADASQRGTRLALEIAKMEIYHD